MSILKFFLTESKHSSDEESDSFELDPPNTEDINFINDEPSSSNYSLSTVQASSSSSFILSPCTELEPPLRLSTKRGRPSTPTELDISAAVFNSPKTLCTAAKKQARFHLQSKNIFLTFPQCPYPLDDFYANLQKKFPDPKNRICCSREKHEDGSWHLHAMIMLENKLQTKSVKYFDALVHPPKHPNIVSKIRSQSDTVTYVMKGSDEALLRSSFNWKAFTALAKKKRSTKFTDIVECVNESIKSLISDPNTILDSLHHQAPDFFAGHVRHLKDYVSFRTLKARRDGFAAAQLISVSVRPAPLHFNSCNRALATWINANLRKPRAHRQVQLWIKADPGVGKTTLIQMLETTFSLSIYYWPKEENWWDGYSDGAYDLIVLDEFNAHKKITQLNPILSGDVTPLSRRNDAPYIKRDILPVIILSNFTPQFCYHKAYERNPEALAPLIDRLEIIDFGEQLVRVVPGVPDPEPDFQLEIPLLAPDW